MNIFKQNIEDDFTPIEDSSQWSRYKVKITDGQTGESIYLHLNDLSIFMPKIYNWIKDKLHRIDF